jgi:hypothetical protein
MANGKKILGITVGSKTFTAIVTACIVTVIFGAGIFVAYNLGQNANGENTSDTSTTTAATVGTITREMVVTTASTAGRGMVVAEENASSIKEWAETPVEDGYYRVQMNMKWDFPDGESPSSNAYVANAETNTRTVYFDLTLNDTNELLYSSPFIPVTAKLDEITLNRDLEKGEYPAMVTYHLVDDNLEEITTVSINIILNVEG